jgi:hypothetical protein
MRQNSARASYFPQLLPQTLAKRVKGQDGVYTSVYQKWVDKIPVLGAGRLKRDCTKG